MFLAWFDSRIEEPSGADLGLGGGGEGWIGWIANPLLKKRKKWKKLLGRNKGKHSGQVPHSNFSFVVLLVCLVNSFKLSQVLKLQHFGSMLH